jgi:flavin reductase (DIM6/NTAB) family NADH-FMN oxidoreductase RutF
MEFISLNLESFYRVLAPRPTILVTTRSPEGDVNAAPFSFTMPVSVKPPLVALASVPSHHTFQNLKDTGEMVVNVPSAPLLQKLWVTGEKFPQGVNELEKAGLTQLPSVKVSPPRIKDCIAHMECKVTLTRECGDHHLVLGEVLELSVRDDAIVDGLLDVEKMKPILHLGGKDFVVGDHRKKVY